MKALLLILAIVVLVGFVYVVDRLLASYEERRRASRLRLIRSRSKLKFKSDK